MISTPVLVSKHLNVLRTNYLKMHAKSNPNHSPPRVGVGWMDELSMTDSDYHHLSLYFRDYIKYLVTRLFL